MLEERKRDCVEAFTHKTIEILMLFYANVVAPYAGTPFCVAHEPFTHRSANGWIREMSLPLPENVVFCRLELPFFFHESMLESATVSPGILTRFHIDLM